MKKFILAGALICLLTILVAPVLVNAAATLATPPGFQGATDRGQLPQGGCTNLDGGGLKGVVNCTITIFGYIVTVLIAAAVVYVIYGAFLMIGNEEKRGQGKEIIMYGIIGIFVMVSVWGLVNILTGTFKFTTNTPITPPAIINPI